MYKNNRIIVVIPARGGSKGIPRKNIRLLANKPLIGYSIETALNSNYVDDVVVTTDDDEIKFISEQFGAFTIKRSNELAEDDVPLDPVIFNAVNTTETLNGVKYDFIITIQPTSPLLKSETLNKTIEKLYDKDNDTIISVVDDRHLSWGFSKEKNSYYPLYDKRVNRQYLPKAYKETGGIFATKREFLKEDSRLGNNINLIEVSNHESIDIDNYEDWWVAERLLNKKRVLIKTDATDEIGTGHIYRGLAIASKLANHEVLFLLDESKKLGIDIVENHNYPYLTHKSFKNENTIDNTQNSENTENIEDNYNNNIYEECCEINQELINEIEDYDPDIIINDILNTSAEYISKLKENKYFVINFEDLGEGAELADIVFDALYEHQIPSKNVYSGHKYYILKDEFYYQKQKNIENIDEVNDILLTFGGTDPNNLTKKTLDSLLKSSYNGKITVILGLGYKNKKGIKEEFAKYSNISIFENVKNISEYMYNADLIFTSAGRTMYEIASIGVPCVCLCQNQRELTHTFGNAENGFLNLGLGKNLSKKELIKTIETLLNDNDLRREMNKRMLSIDLKHGFENMIKIVKSKYKDFDKI
ncbi:UDP-2,4-diacetamido-2,4,6-trideoxy-beta-L-altropyranose hydrolase [Methanobrevibacter sp. TMH8]|uniref:cytidylyltransferase domain-containing protein n=1 Tax=Methanobrevibacter sp. TMH8 TaxID=2848611 RepID=UPI001CCFB703|nr:glycosyltransferase [Methanobrevibacter sp. TMH8]MBZ9571201.1 UDP-2,4-diacetamido-2,4,6-trideoxy-beta-L-altropyranose hydrolase [Methanobrevibacter sp. TMH8]